MIFGSISSIKITTHRWENKPSSLTGNIMTGPYFCFLGFQQIPSLSTMGNHTPICFPVDAGADVYNRQFQFFIAPVFHSQVFALLPFHPIAFLFCIVTISADLLLSICVCVCVWNFRALLFIIRRRRAGPPLVARATPAIIIHIMAPDLNDRIICIEWRCYITAIINILLDSLVFLFSCGS